MQSLEISGKTKMLVITALLFAIAVILSAVEHALPPIYPPLPGVRLGLSNTAVMFALFFVKRKSAFSVAVLKAFFVFITKGWVAGTLSLFGGVLSLLVMMLLIALFKEGISYTVLSIFGAIFHNIGQVAGICIIYNGLFLWTYAPVLIISGTIAGIATATLLRFALPAAKKAKLGGLDK